MNRRYRSMLEAEQVEAWDARIVAYMIEEGFLVSWPFEITRAGRTWLRTR